MHEERKETKLQDVISPLKHLPVIVSAFVEWKSIVDVIVNYKKTPLRSEKFEHTITDLINEFEFFLWNYSSFNPELRMQIQSDFDVRAQFSFSTKKTWSRLWKRIFQLFIERCMNDGEN